MAHTREAVKRTSHQAQDRFVFFFGDMLVCIMHGGQFGFDFANDARCLAADLAVEVILIDAVAKLVSLWRFLCEARAFCKSSSAARLISHVRFDDMTAGGGGSDNPSRTGPLLVNGHPATITSQFNEINRRDSRGKCQKTPGTREL
jgi:hypothetical protein